MYTTTCYLKNMTCRTIHIIGLLLLMFSHTLAAQELLPYRLYNAQGKKVKYAQMLQQIRQADVVFFGEVHNDPMSHWMSLHMLEDLQKVHQDLVLGMEMFEADDQIVLNEYQQGLIQEAQLLSEAKVWDQYATEYKPMVDYAISHKVKVFASNIPRRYASVVFHKGLSALDSLSEEARKWMAPLPITVDTSLSSYQEMVEAMGGHGGAATDNFISAQAIKDATMAYFIAQHLPAHVLHINGAYHTQDKEGIAWYLKQSHPELNIMTIHSVPQEDVAKLEKENKGKGDYILCLPADMIKTH